MKASCASVLWGAVNAVGRGGRGGWRNQWQWRVRRQPATILSWSGGTAPLSHLCSPRRHLLLFWKVYSVYSDSNVDCWSNQRQRLWQLKWSWYQDNGNLPAERFPVITRVMLTPAAWYCEQILSADDQIQGNTSSMILVWCQPATCWAASHQNKSSQRNLPRGHFGRNWELGLNQQNPTNTILSRVVCSHCYLSAVYGHSQALDGKDCFGERIRKSYP